MSFPRYERYRDSGADWLGEIPDHWTNVPLKHLADFINGDAFKPTDWAEAGIPIIRIQNLNGSDEFNYFDGEVEERYLVRDEDLLFGWSGNRGTSFGPFIWRRREVCALNQHIFRVVPRSVDKQELYWILKAVTAHVEDQAHGIIGMVHVTKGDLGAIKVPVAPLDEQASIATFLDRETAKIDALVEEQQRLIELLKEKRQAVISQAVTKGLDPNVPMKDSGVEWLGEVPAHWSILALSRVATSWCDGPFGSGIKSDHYTESGALVVRLQNIRSSGFYVGEPAYLDQGYFMDSLSRHAVLDGDVLIAGLGDENNLVGRACVAPPDIGMALVKADCFRFRMNQDVAMPAFVALQLNAGAACDGGRMATGSTRSRIPLGAMASRRIALPPIDEQSEISIYIERQTNRFDALTLEAESAMTLLQERRSALISAAVTGKIDVRSMAPDPSVVAA